MSMTSVERVLHKKASLTIPMTMEEKERFLCRAESLGFQSVGQYLLYLASKADPSIPIKTDVHRTDKGHIKRQNTILDQNALLMVGRFAWEAVHNGWGNSESFLIRLRKINKKGLLEFQESYEKHDLGDFYSKYSLEVEEMVKELKEHDLWGSDPTIIEIIDRFREKAEMKNV